MNLHFSVKKYATAILLISLSHPALFPGKAVAQLTPKESKKNFDLADHRSPFKKSDQVALTSINLRFKLATREKEEKRGAGSSVTWAILQGVDSTVFQEIADEYYKRLAARFEKAGWKLSDAYKENKHYQTLTEKEKERVTVKKEWGIAEVYTANREPYIEYPMMATAAHAKMGNSLDMPAGQILITIDFAEITQKVSASIPFSLPHEIRTKEVSAKTTLVPVIRIEGLTSSQVFRGNGSYALFTGTNWGYTNVTMKVAHSIFSQKAYAAEIESCKDCMPSFAKRNALVSEAVTVLSMGRAGTSGKGSIGTFTFGVQADREKYKAAVLDALDQFNDHLITLITSTK